MARKNYSAEFRRDAVELYRVTDGATNRGHREANERTLSTERDILRAAAKYFAGETNW